VREGVIMAGSNGRVKLLTSWQPGSKESKKGTRVSLSLSRASPHKVPPPPNNSTAGNQTISIWALGDKASS
jgi:hypothetical protein